MNKGQIFIICGPSGVGKGTLMENVLKNYDKDDVFFSVSVTTRKPRPGEIDGVSYHYISKEEFDDILSKDGLLEYNVYCNTCYGSPEKPVLEALENGKLVLFDIDINGMRQIIKKHPDAVSVFIMPPKVETLEQRLRTRGTETEEQIQKRLETAKEEMKFKDECKYVIVNDDLEKATQELYEIFKKNYK